MTDLEKKLPTGELIATPLSDRETILERIKERNSALAEAERLRAENAELRQQLTAAQAQVQAVQGAVTEACADCGIDTCIDFGCFTRDIHSLVFPADHAALDAALEEARGYAELKQHHFDHHRDLEDAGLTKQHLAGTGEVKAALAAARREGAEAAARHMEEPAIWGEVSYVPPAARKLAEAIRALPLEE